MWLWLKRGWRLERAVPVAVFALGSCLSVLGGVWRSHDTQTLATAAFELSVDRVADDVVRRIRQPIYGLRGAGGMYAASPRVGRAEFRAYVE